MSTGRAQDSPSEWWDSPNALGLVGLSLACMSVRLGGVYPTVAAGFHGSFYNWINKLCSAARPKASPLQEISVTILNRSFQINPQVWRYTLRYQDWPNAVRSVCARICVRVAQRAYVLKHPAAGLLDN